MSFITSIFCLRSRLVVLQVLRSTANSKTHHSFVILSQAPRLTVVHSHLKDSPLVCDPLSGPTSHTQLYTATSKNHHSFVILSKDPRLIQPSQRLTTRFKSFVILSKDPRLRVTQKDSLYQYLHLDFPRQVPCSSYFI